MKLWWWIVLVLLAVVALGGWWLMRTPTAEAPVPSGTPAPNAPITY